MTTANFFRWQRESFGMSFLQLRQNQEENNNRVRYDVTVLDDGHLVAAIYDLSVPYHANTSQHVFEKQCVEAVINFILSDNPEQVVTNWRHDLRRERLAELAKDLDAWKASSATTDSKTQSL